MQLMNRHGVCFKFRLQIVFHSGTKNPIDFGYYQIHSMVQTNQKKPPIASISIILDLIQAHDLYFIYSDYNGQTTVQTCIISEMKEKPVKILKRTFFHVDRTKEKTVENIINKTHRH